MRWATLAGLVPLAVACTPPEPDAPTATTVEVTPPPAVGAAPAEPPPVSTAVPPPASASPAVPSPRAEATERARPEAQPSEADVKACAARGGNMERVCLTGHLTCVLRYRDAGKPCTDKFQCQGECLYNGEEPPPKNATGHCQATSDPCGCKTPMLRGQVQPTLCAD